MLQHHVDCERVVGVDEDRELLIDRVVVERRDGGQLREVRRERRRLGRWSERDRLAETLVVQGIGAIDLGDRGVGLEVAIERLLPVAMIERGVLCRAQRAATHHDHEQCRQRRAQP